MRTTLSMQTPYQRIVTAAKEGKGVRLTPAECKQMSIDNAIEERARLDGEEFYVPEPTPELSCARCGHRKSKHHNGRGMCMQQINFICNCSRFRTNKL